MGEGAENQMLQGPSMDIPQYDNYAKREDNWVIKKAGDDDHDGMYDTTSTCSNISSTSSSISADFVDDASSSASASSSCSSSLNSGGSLYDLSDLMAQLPIRRGLSKYFQGKCQSFTSLSKVKSIEDLAKKESPYNQRKALLLKASKSYGGGLGTHRSSPYITKTKKASPISSSRGSLSSNLSFRSRSSSRGSSLGINTLLPPIPVTKRV